MSYVPSMRTSPCSPGVRAFLNALTLILTDQKEVVYEHFLSETSNQPLPGSGLESPLKKRVHLFKQEFIFLSVLFDNGQKK